ncbi:alkane hydroxylase MAH1-like [Brassica napus]|uniref:alkane hydroxylase MAH1-like n=1 Tax=Brassica napus TaxID=3708 RepID=UPI002079736E|nr:alkane hydroxylase MAH1-like [Brassica napus]
MTPGLLVRIHRINDSVEVLENSNMTFPFKGPWFAGKDVLITVDPANIQHIVTSNFSNYIKGAEFQEIFEVCGDGIINSDADRASKLKKCYQALLRHQGFQRDSMSITTRKLNDVSLSIELRENEFVKALDDVAEAIVYRHFTLRFMRNLQKWIGFGPEKKMVEADAIIDRVCAKYISAKRDEIQQGTSSHHEDVLTFFIKLDTTKYELLNPIDDRTSE